MTLDRRHFLTAAGAGVATLAAGCATPNAANRPGLPFFIGSPAQTLLPKGKAPRVVVCGGGWGGLTTAKYLRQLAPGAEVVLLERNPVFFSCPISNKWLVDMVDTSFITHDYLRVSERHGYRFIQAEVLEVDRGAKRVVTSLGALDYDYLVLAPGIRYNYEAWFGNDRRVADATRARFPAAYVSNAEHFTLKQALHNFKGGDWVMTLPPPPQRCPPSPYERACMVAWYFKKNNIKGKVTILDHKDGVRPIGPGFRAAFNELYKDYITYVPNAHVQSIDPFKKEIKTDAGDMKFDHAVLMAPHQAGDLAWKADTIGRTSEGKPNGWADVDPLMLHLKGDPSVYVIGDAVGVVSPQFAFYPKSAHVANKHGHIVAGYIAERVAGRDPKLTLPDNLCYMMVNGEPREAISVQFDYKVNDKGVIEQTQIDVNQRSGDLVKENFRWAGLKFEDMFG
ncbi:FAD/NAD(P)-binding oxidoreductase [uncultured Hydrogenophaga sp.]|uniref:NAD(P)/FAD-dependent oxidoreductase n=1 Tax=uncultured Hydrogenophaga sp. TaxID=199683 RepID=UPI002588EEF0|nr:FAD/NAD(P)-binding oxidoreductase [uncultured Hydrogenophaga sp.]